MILVIIEIDLISSDDDYKNEEEFWSECKTFLTIFFKSLKFRSKKLTRIYRGVEKGEEIELFSFIKICWKWIE